MKTFVHVVAGCYKPPTIARCYVCIATNARFAHQRAMTAIYRRASISRREQSISRATVPRHRGFDRLPEHLPGARSGSRPVLIRRPGLLRKDRCGWEADRRLSDEDYRKPTPACGTVWPKKGFAQAHLIGTMSPPDVLYRHHRLLASISINQAS
jgi:hypothetical protein